MAEESRYAVTDPAKPATFCYEHLVGERLLDSIRKSQDDISRIMVDARVSRVEHMLSMLPEGWGLAVSPWKPEPWPDQNRMTFQVKPIPPEGEATPIPAGWQIFRSKKFGPFD